MTSSERPERWRLETTLGGNSPPDPMPNFVGRFSFPVAPILRYQHRDGPGKACWVGSGTANSRRLLSDWDEPELLAHLGVSGILASR